MNVTFFYKTNTNGYRQSFISCMLCIVILKMLLGSGMISASAENIVSTTLYPVLTGEANIAANIPIQLSYKKKVELANEMVRSAKLNQIYLSFVEAMRRLMISIFPRINPINIVHPQDPQLQKLVQYQNVMGGFVADHLMVFMNMPQSGVAIEGASYYMANIMNEYAQYGITPVFIFEPIGDNGIQLDLGRLKKGEYGANLELLFSLIKNERKITEEKLGIMIPYPEINTPAFDRANFVPRDLATLVNIFFDSIKKYYPNVKGGVLLDSESYDMGASWDQGKYQSFAPYLRGINPRHIQIFCLQGFPWASDDLHIKIYDPTIFLPINIAEEAATLLGVKNIWFNTGTMRKQYPDGIVSMNPAERTATLNGIINQATILQSKGYTTMINLFAQNKFSLGENIDWSYIENSHDGILSPHEAVLSSFLQQAQSRRIKVGLFDK